MMYLLLRDNKQSGPYSVDELKAKGLKAYDLVWVEGRSAAWRYPSEIEELKVFAPVVEEQPFDRFYKKPATATTATAAGTSVTTTTTTVSATPVAATTTATPVTVTQPATATHPAIKRTIYVTMPGVPGKEDAPVREVAPMREVAPVREVARESMPVRELVPVREAEAAPVRERVRRKTSSLWLPVGIGVGVLALLAVGIFIGLSIQKGASGAQKLASQTASKVPVMQTSAQQPPVSGTGTVGAGNSGTAATGLNPGIGARRSETTGAVGNAAVGNAAVENAAVGAIRPEGQEAGRSRLTVQKQKAEVSKTQAAGPAATNDSAGAQGALAQREAIHRTDVTTSQPVVDREAMKLGLANQVAVSANNYQVGTFGGIRNLQVTVTNHSAYSLDLVVVAVSYIQANKKTYKTVNLYFRGIGPGSALMLEAPKTSRGINVEYKIISINSKELGLSEPGT